MFWEFAKLSVTVPVRPARLPPEAVTSYWADEPDTAVTVAVAVVPATSKSAASTFVTLSEKVTRQVRLSPLVGVVAGLWRPIDVTVGSVLSVRVSTCTSMKAG